MPGVAEMDAMVGVVDMVVMTSWLSDVCVMWLS